MALSVGIAGAGVAGLAAAALLARQGARVAVLDRFDAPGPVGSGLVIQPVGLAVLDRLGAGAAARAMGAPIDRLLGLEAATGRRVLDVGYGTGAAGLALHRAALFAALHDAALAHGAELRPGHPVAGRDGRRLVLADGRRTEPFDLLVDAAGARSPLSPLRGRPLAYGALWATVPWPAGSPLDPRHLSQRYRRAARMMGVLPVGRLPGDPTPRAAVFWSLPADGHDAWLARGIEAWRDEARALWPEAAPFLDSLDRPAQLTMARYEHGALRRPVADGLAHLGDAAHRASPQLGQGANMALLDALALALALDAHPGDLGDALAAYARARAAHLALYQLLSRLFTPQYQGDGVWLPRLRDHVLAPLSRVPPLPRILAALVGGRLVPPLASLLPTEASHPRHDAP